MNIASLSPRKQFSGASHGLENPLLKTMQTPEQAAQSQISSLMKRLDNFTADLEAKVDGLLNNQKEEFFRAYRGFLMELSNRMKQMERTIEQQKNTIEEYESEGELSKLIRKVNAYEKELNEVYEKMAEKERSIQEYRVKNEIVEKVNLQLHDRLKLLMREQRELKCKHAALRDNQKNSQQSPQDVSLFATEVKERANDKTHDQSLIAASNRNAQCLESAPRKADSSKEKLECKRLRQEMKRLQQRNLSLVKLNGEVSSTHSELQDFFLKCVMDIKKHIAARNSLSQCSFEDFRKEDKIKLLIWVLSNDQVIAGLHSVIFGAGSPTIESKTTSLQHYDTLKLASEVQSIFPNHQPQSLNNSNSEGMQSSRNQKCLPKLPDLHALSLKRRRMKAGYFTAKRLSDVY